MYDFATLKLISLCTELSGRLDAGIVAFSDVEYAEEVDNMLIYDDKTNYHFPDKPYFAEDDLYPIVADCCADENHHDIISTYEMPGARIFLVIASEGSDTYIYIDFGESGHGIIIDEFGWKFIE